MSRCFVALAALAAFACSSCVGVTVETDIEPDEVPGMGPLCGQPPSDEPAPTSCVPGQLDSTFGAAGTGSVRLSIKPDDAGGVRAIAASTGGLLVAGDGLGGLGGSTFKVARLTEEGSPDIGFGGGAVVVTQWGSSTANYAVARGVGRQSGGRAVVIGSFDDVASQDVALARYLPDGSLDASFGADGKPLVDLGGSEIIEAGLVLPDGRILAAGSRDGQVLIARFTEEGALDTSFAAPEGFFTAPIGDASGLRSVAVDCNGRVIAAGFTVSGGQTDVLLLRFTEAGALDGTFGTGGRVIAGDHVVDERAVAVAVTRDRRYVVAGDAGPVGGGDRDFQVRRFRANGAVDSKFGSAGVVTAPLTPGDDQAESMVVTSEGSILVAGNSQGEGAAGPIALRLTPAGELDTTFGTGGALPLDLGEFGVVHAVQLDARGRALIGGGDEGASPGPGTFLVVQRLCL